MKLILLAILAVVTATGQTTIHTPTKSTQNDGVVDQPHQTFLNLEESDGVLLPPGDFHFDSLGIPTDFTFMVWILPT